MGGGEIRGEAAGGLPRMDFDGYLDKGSLGIHCRVELGHNGLRKVDLHYCDLGSLASNTPNRGMVRVSELFDGTSKMK